MSDKAVIGKLVGSIAACYGAGAIGSAFTTPKIPTWYATLEKPSFTPPDAVFMPVWLTLYALMGIAVFLIWRKGLQTDGVKPAFILFWVQLVLNALWSVVFFGYESPAGGFAIILALGIILLITTIKFFKISRVAGGLLVPYLSWIVIAASLNGGIMMLNP
ncbi:MAG: tryptophan-rich sensory protein [Dehalococcoidales bacterium]|nr:tryptophan-rich sensory protein [Dehalococcoidales bacterium]